MKYFIPWLKELRHIYGLRQYSAMAKLNIKYPSYSEYKAHREKYDALFAEAKLRIDTYLP